MGSLNFYKLLGGSRLWGIVVSFLLLWACGSDDPADPENPDIKKPDASKFGFTLLKITNTKEISVDAIKKQLKSESGWTIKSITIDDESFAEVTGTLPNLKIILKKSGSFTASITLQKKGWQDFVLKDCKIQVVLPQFSFSKFTQSKSKKTITSVEILKQIAGAQAAGYAIKSIVVSDENFAKVSGTAPTLQIDIQKVGKFTATIVLSRKSFFEITLKDCAFEIAPEFIFSKLRRSISGSKTITAAEILKQIAGAQAAGYTIKSIAITEDTKKIATVKNGTSIDFTKEGVFKATIILKKDQHSDITLKDCEFEISGKKAAPTLTFTKLSRKFSTALITKTQILRQIKEDTTGWTLKSVVLSNASFGDVDSNFSIRLKKIGNFSAKLTFERTGYVAAQVTGSFEITKGFAKSLKFAKLTVSSKGIKTITAAQILGQIANVKTWGYGLKSIGKINNSDVASASGTQITIKKAGSFTTELILESAYYEDAKVQASFEVSGKNVAPVLSFATLKRNYSGSKTITKAQILNQITATSGQADWAGYVLKSIVLTENASLVRVNNATFEITILKAGTFKAQLTFTKDTYVDAVVTGTFEIAKAAAPSLTFGKLTKPLGETITAANILNNVKGSGKTGYTLKSIVITSGGDVATVSGKKPALQIVSKKLGTFKATLVLERANYEDATINDADFEIVKGRAAVLRFDKLTKRFGETITAANILTNVKGSGKTGYTLKSIAITSGSDVATVGSLKEIVSKKAGTFKATLVLESTNYEDATIKGASFEIAKGKAKVLTFPKLIRKYRGNLSETFTTAQILANVGGQKDSYTIRSLSYRSGGGFYLSYLNQKKVVFYKFGTGTLTIRLESPNYDAVNLVGDFEFAKGTAPVLFLPPTLDRLNNDRTDDTISAADILKNVKGNKTGYTVKSVSNLDYPASPFIKARITNDGKGIEFVYFGSYTATITLEHNKYEDVVFNKHKFRYINVFSVVGGEIRGYNDPKWKTRITRLDIPGYMDGQFITSIGVHAFSSAPAIISVSDPAVPHPLTYVKLPTGVTSIKAAAFADSSQLATLILPSGLKTIGDEAFRFASKLTAVRIPISVSYIGDRAFMGCSKLNVTVEEPDPSKTSLGDYTFKDVPIIYVPSRRRYRMTPHDWWRWMPVFRDSP